MSTSTTGHPLAVNIELLDGKLYWSGKSTSSIYTQSIFRANIDGTTLTGIEEIVTSVENLVGLVLDEATQKMYWTDQVNKLVQSANLDGTSVQTLSSGTRNAYRGIALDQESSKLYWTSSFSLVRSNTNGSDVQVLPVTGSRVGLEVGIREAPIFQASIDIKPRKNPKNVIDLRKDKELKVAIVGSDAFDALQVDPSTVKFGTLDPDAASPINFKGQDYNRDGFSDLILIFNLSETGIICGITEATLTGSTFPDPVTNIIGSDSFTVEPCN